MQPIAIYGAGGLGREILMLIRQINLARRQWEPLGFFDDKCEAGQSVHGLPVLGGMDALNNYPDPLNIVIAVGDPGLKKGIREHIRNDQIAFPRLIHPSVEIQSFQYIGIGEGSIIAAGNILTTDIIIGRHVLLNLACTIGHDVYIGDYSSLMPGCNVSGNVTFGEGAYIGTGASLINSVEVGAWATIGAGAVVIDNIQDGKTAVGIPARPLTKE